MLAIAVSAGCAPRTPEPVDRQVRVEALPSPAIGASSSPQLTSIGGRPMLSWLESADLRATLKYSSYTADGWSEPRTVVSDENIVVSAADVPGVYRFDNGTTLAQWMQHDGRNPIAYDLWLSSSKDDGRTWTTPMRPHHDGTPTQHGFASVFQIPGGNTGLIWLDGRATDPEKPEGENGNMALWSAAFGPDGLQVAEGAVDERVCDCCQTSAAATSDAVLVAYRDRTADEIRDIVVGRFADGRWQPPVNVHDDGWSIYGCPVNGPAIDARGDEVAVAWFTGSSGEPRAFVAFSRDGGRTFAEPIRVDEGGPRGHVDVQILADGWAAVSWVEADEGRSLMQVRHVAVDGGATSSAVTVAEVDGSTYPRMAESGGSLLFAWAVNEDGYSRVRTARAAAH